MQLCNRLLNPDSCRHETGLEWKLAFSRGGGEPHKHVPRRCRLISREVGASGNFSQNYPYSEPGNILSLVSGVTRDVPLSSR